MLKHPPKNPSHVFLGDNSINLCFPNETPNMYANVSFTMTNEQGKMNHTNPSNVFIIITEL